MLRSDASSVLLNYDNLIFQNRNRAYAAFDPRRHCRPTRTCALALSVGLFFMNVFVATLGVYVLSTNPLAYDPAKLETELIKRPEPSVKAVSPVLTSIVQPTVSQRTPVGLAASEHWPEVIVELPPAITCDPVIEGETITEVIPAPEAHGPTRVETCGVEPEPEVVFAVVEQQPEYAGGVEALRNFLSTNLIYPRLAASAEVSGRVLVSFVVNSDGSLADVNVVKGLGFGCDEEAVRVVKRMPRWKPGKQSSRAVRVRHNLPISFALE